MFLFVISQSCKGMENMLRSMLLHPISFPAFTSFNFDGFFMRNFYWQKNLNFGKYFMHKQDEFVGLILAKLIVFVIFLLKYSRETIRPDPRRGIYM